MLALPSVIEERGERRAVAAVVTGLLHASSGLCGGSVEQGPLTLMAFICMARSACVWHPSLLALLRQGKIYKNLIKGCIKLLSVVPIVIFRVESNSAWAIFVSRIVNSIICILDTLAEIMI